MRSDDPASNVTDVRSEASWNARTPIDVTDFGITTDVSPDASNASVSIVSNAEPAWNDTEVSPVAFSKALRPIDVTVDGMVAVPVQVESFVTTLFVIVNDPGPEQFVVAHAGAAGAPTSKAAMTATEHATASARGMLDTGVPDAPTVSAALAGHTSA